MTTGVGTRLPDFASATGFTDGDFVYMTQSGATVKGTIAQLRTALSINRAVETFVAGINFTAGTTTSLTLAGSYGSINNIDVYFDGVPQLDCTLVGNTLTFNPVITTGTQEVVVKGGATCPIGVPADGSVSDAKLSPGSKVFNRSNDEISVTDFVGADPSGVQDSLAAFNAAAVQSASSKKTVYVPAGVWKLSALPTIGTSSWRISPSATFSGVWPYFFRGFYTNINVSPFGNGSNVHRLNDRVMVGTATKYDGKNNPTATDWINTLYPDSNGVSAFGYMLTNATMGVGAPIGQLGITSYGRTSDSGAGGNGVIGVGSVVVNDNTIGAGSTGWGYYATMVKGVGATGLSTIGIELDITNLGAEADIYPNFMFPNGLTAALWLAAGGELPSQVGASGLYTFNKVSAAIGIFANQPGPFTNCVFEKGIVFGKGSVSSQVALAMPVNYSMTWFNDGNAVTSAILSSATLSDAPHIQKLQFSDFGTLVVDGSGNTQFRVLNGLSSSVNYLAAQAQTTGNAPAIMALGSDTNVDLALTPQGSGFVSFGAYTAGTIAQAGYITVKDAGGTLRRLLVG